MYHTSMSCFGIILLPGIPILYHIQAEYIFSDLMDYTFQAQECPLLNCYQYPGI